jgi:ABC-2 type transport system permease protein
MFRTLLFKELREQRRTYRLWIISLVLLVSGMMSPLLAKYTPLLIRSIPGVPPALAAIIPEPTILDSFTQYVKNVSQFGLIVVIVLTMGVMAQEVDRGTAAMLLTKPVQRSAVVLAKWSAGLLSILVGLVLAVIAFTFYTLVLFGTFSLRNFLALNSLMLVFMMFYMSLALFASALARTQAMAAAGAFGGLVLALILSALPVIRDYLPGELLSWGGSLLSGAPQAAWPALAASLILSATLVGAAIWRFQNQEL